MKDEVPIFDLVITVMSSGITPSTYVKRAMILQNYHQINEKSKVLNLHVINCDIVVRWLSGKLFKECSSFMEESKCNYGCPKVRKSLPVKQMDETTVFCENAPSLMAYDCILGPRKCPNKNCRGQSTTTLLNTGMLCYIN